MGTRKECRERLGVLFTANGSFNAVYDYAPTGFNGATKVLTIYSSKSRHEVLSKHLKNDFYSFYLETYVLRSGATAEDDLDDLHDAVRAVIQANISDPNGDPPAWNELFLDEESDPFFAEVSGKSYRAERHKLLIKVSRT